MPAVFPNVQGRLIAAIRIIHRQDGFLIDTESATLETVPRLLERFTLAGDFRVKDLTSETAMLSVQGKNAAEIIRKALGETSAMVARGQVATAQLENGSHVNVIRATHTGEDGFDLFIAANEGQTLLELLTRSGAQAFGSKTADT